MQFFLFLSLSVATTVVSRRQILCTQILFTNEKNKLAARELQRYLTVATNEIVEIQPEVFDDDCKRININISLDDAKLAKDDSFKLSLDNPTSISVSASTPLSCLYGAYTLIETLTEIRFTISGDILPDRTSPNASSSPSLMFSALTSRYYSPSTSTRGLQPFHDFATGPDWWTASDYKHTFENMAKLKLNFLGLHNYPSPFNGPAVWSGTVDEFDPRTGFVTTGEPGVYSNVCSGGVWGGVAMNSSDYAFGAHLMYDKECFNNWDNDVQGQNFNSVGAFLREVFTYARTVFSHKIGVGIEAQTIGETRDREGLPPASLTELYAGTFEVSERASLVAEGFGRKVECDD